VCACISRRRRGRREVVAYTNILAHMELPAAEIARSNEDEVESALQKDHMN
jgi:hypothetical protein